MANYAGESVSSSAGGAITKRTGTTAADAVAVNTVVLWSNTGAGAHVVTLTNSALQDGLAVANRTISIPAGTAKGSFVNPLWGDANGNVAVGIDGTAAEVVYYVMGGF